MLIGISIGKLNSDYRNLFQFYLKQIQTRLNWIEISEKKALNTEGIVKHIPATAFVICLDETGKTMSSPEFSSLLEHHEGTDIVFLIGAAQGLDPKIKARSNLFLSFGKQTWPHQMARVMLIEQIYRAEKIRMGHPYHK